VHVHARPHGLTHARTRAPPRTATAWPRPQAKEKGVRLINEDGLFALIEASVPFVEDTGPAEGGGGEDGAPAAVGDAAMAEAAGPSQAQAHPAGGGAAAAGAAAATAATAATAAAAGRGSGGASGGGAQPPLRPSGGAQAAAGFYGGATQHHAPQRAAQHAAQRPAGAHVPSGETRLWVDKHRPLASHDLVGNNQAIANLSTWIRTWEQVRGRAGGRRRWAARGVGWSGWG
jgi:hypothetical protein